VENTETYIGLNT